MDVPRRYGKIQINESEREEVRVQLDNSHLMQPVDEDYSFYRIHPLVREVFQQQLQPIPEINSRYRCAFVETLLTIVYNISPTPTREIIALGLYKSQGRYTEAEPPYKHSLSASYIANLLFLYQISF